MKGKLFLIHWNAPEAEEFARPLRQDGWQVTVEAEDGARAARQILSSVPDVMVVYLTKLPSHGVGTAYYLRSVRQTRQMPIVFVGGQQEAVAKAKDKVPDAKCINPDELETVLTPLSQ